MILDVRGAMCVWNMNSPLYNTRHALKVFRWTCGFPLQTKDGSYTAFRFVTWLEALRFVIVFLFLRFTYLYVLAWSLIYDEGFSAFTAFYENAFNKFSASKVDQITTVVWHSFVHLSMISYIIVFKYNAKSISVYCKEVSEVKSKINHHLDMKMELKKCCTIQGPEKTIIYQQIINLTASIFIGIWAYVFFFGKLYTEVFSNYGENFPVVYAVLMGTETFFFAFGPISCAVELIICQLINSLGDVIDDWIVLLKHNSDINQANNTTDIQKQGCQASTIDIDSSEM